MLNLKSKIVCIGFVALLVFSSIGAWKLLHTNARLEGKPYTGTNLLERLITRNEGVKRSPYLDAKGNVIIGVGHELSITFTQANRIYPIPLNDDEIDALLSNDLKTVEKQLRGIFRSTRHWSQHCDAKPLLWICFSTWVLAGSWNSMILLERSKSTVGMRQAKRFWIQRLHVKTLRATNGTRRLC